MSSQSKQKKKEECALGEPLSAAARQAFRRRLLRWYDGNRRELPWRGSRDAYRIWVSEVMLQQTRVAAVIDYYGRFLQRFPDVRALAAAKEEEVLAAWSGLGYYRRARALHAAARKIVSERGGELPRSAGELRELPGFGRYTAAAVASIAFGEAAAVVDGNVERVLSRVLGWRQGERGAVWEAAQALLARERPGDFNQAMMELGATVCLPGEAQCGACPVFRWCRTRGREAGKRKQIRRRAQEHYRLARRGDAVWLVQRPGQASLMPGMWELPQVAALGRKADGGWRFRHSITNTDFQVEVSMGEPPSGMRGRWIKQGEAGTLPLTGLARKILRRADFI